MGVFDLVKTALLGRKKVDRDWTASKQYESLVLDIMAERLGDGPEDVARIKDRLVADGVTLDVLGADFVNRLVREEAKEVYEAEKLLPALWYQILKEAWVLNGTAGAQRMLQKLNADVQRHQTLNV